MGLESSNYLFKFDGIRQSDIVLEGLNLKVVLREDNTLKCIKAGSDYWIDFLMHNPQTNEVSIRIALSNPHQVLLELNQSLQVLFALDKNGVLLDRDNKQKFFTVDVSSWEGIMSNYQKRKDVFKGIYGDIELAVSADDFYRQIGSR